ncbi:DUF305 domain-containing protein [Gordonia amicalis]|uniref:DUF305 domain-containing protein n=1 Tax=Gordonia amicalis TaxID=89053 RepID=UPI0002A639CF|nr:DUF305 domain-containing protein [Gordonia amicalis]MBA5849037.1 DUF305 domain-containing protein [Gordonia amicalis]MDV7174113.1 DUF305 domain-containing protein [Gordonia amicalis]NKX77769.1 DUF305 domain-containing protein [Gordonia amicalis]UOG20724.1 DUF305 domain-containing protein [Gordonia amicalis]GAC52751.1 hypothetical protein GOAMI_14_01390 [Gordonia amicalis NBRC 100051 = JCM 11271]
MTERHTDRRTGRQRPAWPQIAGLTSLAVLLVAIGIVVGSVWSPGSRDDVTTMSAADIGFAQDMSAHHDQALLMARTILAAPDVDPTIRGLADQLVVAQSAESATMRGWLQFFGLPLTSDSPMSWMPHDDLRTHGHPSAATPGTPPMPGMASTDELGRLATLRGDEAEKLFLQLMIRHHRGGLDMAQAAYNDDRSGPATKQLALNMLGDQGNEIGQMSMLLKERGAEPLPT